MYKPSIIKTKSPFFPCSLQTITLSNPLLITNPLYNLLPQTQNPNKIVNLICSHLKHNNNTLLTSLHFKKQLLPHLGSHEITRVLLRCQSDPVTSFRFFTWVTNYLSIKLTVTNYCVILHILTWSRNFHLAMKLLCQVIEIECNDDDVFEKLVLCSQVCNWSVIVFDMLIKAYVKTGNVKDGLKVYKKMIGMGLVPDVSACNCLLNGLLKSDRVDLCWEVYNEMGRVEITPNSYTFNILTHVLCKDGDAGKVNEFLEKMEEEGFEPDVVTYNTLIKSYCRKGRLDDAFYLYKIMYRRFVPPDLVTYTVLMKGLCDQGKVKEAHQLFHRMVDRGFNPDTLAYNSLICGYGKEGKMQEAKSLYREMIQRGLSPDSTTCHLLVKGYGKVGKLLSSLNLVVEFQRLGVLIPLEVYNYLGVALCQENRPHAAKSLLRRMVIDGCEPSLEMYNELIQCFCKCDGLTEALSLKDEMIEKGLKPDLFSYRILISSLCKLHRTAKGEFMMKELVGTDLVPDSDICKALVNGYCKERSFHNAESILIYFALEFQIYDIGSYNVLIKVWSEEGNVLKSLELQDKMLKLGFVPNGMTCKSLIYGLSRAGNDKRTVEVVYVETPIKS